MGSWTINVKNSQRCSLVRLLNTCPSTCLPAARDTKEGQLLHPSGAELEALGHACCPYRTLTGGLGPPPRPGHNCLKVATAASALGGSWSPSSHC
jgi:hypothetical protein